MVVIRVAIKSTLPLRIKIKKLLLSLMGHSHSKVYRLGYKCTRHVATMDNVDILWYGGGRNWGVHGWFIGRWRLMWSMFYLFGVVTKKMWRLHLVLNWKICHFMVKEGIVLVYRMSEKRIEVDQSKFQVIERLPQPISVKGVRSVLGHAGFHSRFIKDFK